MKIRDEKTKKNFMKFMKAYPELRFWQSIRAFAGVGFIYTSEQLVRMPELTDTFYTESDKEGK